MSIFLHAASILLTAVMGLSAQTGSGIEEMGSYRGLGGMLASAIGPGPQAGSQRLYLSYLYLDNTFELVAVDPASGKFQVFPNPAKGESGAWAMAVGRDGNVYLGSLPHAHFLKFDPKAGRLTDLGRPSATEEYIWADVIGSDGKLYGATYPHAKLVRYDPASGKLEDLGRMDPVEQYGRSITADDDGFVYIGIGTSRADIVAYRIATGEHRGMLAPESRPIATAMVFRGEDGRIYGTVGPRCYRLQGWNARLIDAKAAPAAMARNRLKDGRIVSVEDHTLRITNPLTKAVTEREFAYEGNTLPLFRLGVGPDGGIYASSILPIHLLRLDRAQHSLRQLGGLGGGEVYSFLTYGKWLLMAAYSGDAPLMRLDPSEPLSKSAGDPNPALVTYPESDESWRPKALIRGPKGLVYAGAVSGYGKLGGPLTVWDISDDRVESYANVVAHQSVVSLAAWKSLIAGGTTVAGGGGSHEHAKEAEIFLWDPRRHEKLFETVPVPGARSVTDLITAPNSLVYGIAGRVLFVFDPEQRRIVAREPLPGGKPLYNSVQLGPDGRIWGLAQNGIFAIDPARNEVSLIARAPQPITAGWAMKDGYIYFISNATVYRYQMPKGTLRKESKASAPATGMPRP